MLRPTISWLTISVLTVVVVMSANGIASAQSSDGYAVAASGIPTVLQTSLDSYYHNHHCVNLDPAMSVEFGGGTHSLKGFCTFDRASGAPYNDEFLVFWASALPNGVDTMNLLPYIHIYYSNEVGATEGYTLETIPNQLASRDTVTWSVRSPTYTLPAKSSKSLLDFVPSSTEVYVATLSGSASARQLAGRWPLLNGRQNTMLLTSHPMATGLAPAPTEIRVASNEAYTERTVTWVQENADGGDDFFTDTEVHRQELVSSETGSNLWSSDTYFLKADGVDIYGKTFTDNTVLASTTYRYRVRSINFEGNGHWSEYYLSSELPRDEPSAVPAVIYPRPDQERFTLADDGSPRGYQFEIIGEDAAWPVQVAIQGDAFRLSATLQTVTDCTGLDDTLSIERDAREFYLYVCEAGDATLLLRSGVDGQLYADYPLFTAATTVAPRPDQPPGELFVDRSGEDHPGITGALEQLFEHTAMNADPVLAKNFLVLVLTVGIGAVPLLRRGRMDVPALTNGFILASLVMWGATIVAGHPIWWAVTPSALLVSVGIIGFASRLRAGR